MEPQRANEFVKAASPNMLNVIKRKITILTIIIVVIAPVSHACTNGGVNNITSNIDRSIDHETQSYLSHMRILQRQNSGYRDVEQKNSGINGTSEVKREDLAKAAELIDCARAGGPSGLVHLGSASDAVDRPIEVYDEQGKLMYVVGDSKDGTSAKVEYHEPKDCEVIGHYTLPGGKEPTIRSGGRNMCLYNVLAEQTGHDPNKLKDSVLNIMTKNIETFAKQMSDIAHLEMYSRMKLALGGAAFHARNPDETLQYLTNSDHSFGFRNPNRAHPGHHIPYRRSTGSLLRSVSTVLNKRIEVFEVNGRVRTIIGRNIGGEPITLQYHKPAGDTSGEYFSSVGGREVYRLQDPRPPTPGSPNFWGVLLTAVKSAVIEKMDAEIIPPRTYCVEVASRNRDGRLGRKTGYISKDEAAFVTYYAMQTAVVKRRLDKLNEYRPSVKDSDEYVFAEITLSAQELNMSRTAFGAEWNNGKIVHVWPITGPIFIKLQHYNGWQNDRTAWVQFQTNYPMRPPPNQYIF